MSRHPTHYLCHLALLHAIICQCQFSRYFAGASTDLRQHQWSKNANVYCFQAPPYVSPLLSRSGGKSKRSTTVKSVVEDKLESFRAKWKNMKSEKKGGSKSSQAPSDGERVPFVIQKIGRGDEKELKDVTRLCIDVFFNKQDENANAEKSIAPWKAMQLAYLRGCQYGEYRARNAFRSNQLVDLIVARKVVAVSDTTNNVEGLAMVEDQNQIINFEQFPSDVRANRGDTTKFALGEIIGYCEVSEKKFGLGSNFDSNKNGPGDKPRPYLSNLSVVEDARGSGVGSRLLDACEECVNEWNAGHTEIVLQVEEDNQSAVQFYKKRGWEFVFADPTCRRYDTSGFFLRESRITKYAMIKRLSAGANKSADGTDQNVDANDFGSFFLRKIKDSFPLL